MGRGIHVVREDVGWGVKREGSGESMATRRTQGEAISMARSFAQAERSEVVIHRRDGKIRDKDSYGNDPFPPRDKRH